MPLALLGVASALSPFGMVVVVPTLAELARRYSIDYADVQFLISAYLFGLGVAQPFSGWLCDRFGRRRVLLAGFSLFVLASLGCAIAGSFGLLVALRFLQATGVSVGTVASRAILRDIHDEAGTARTLALVAAAMGIAPVIGPVAGGLLSNRFGPQSVFTVSAALGLLVLWQIARRLPETLPPQAVAGGGWIAAARDYRSLFTSRRFMGYTLMYGASQGSFFAFLAVGAAVFEQDLGIDQQGFGLAWGLLAICYVFGATAASRLGKRVGHWRLLLAGVLLTGLSTAGIWLLAAAGAVGFLPLMLLLGLMTLASGIVIPGAMAGAVSYRPDIAGTSSGLSSAAGLVLSGAFTILAGLIYGGSFLPVAGLMALAGLATGATALMVRRHPPAA